MYSNKNNNIHKLSTKCQYKATRFTTGALSLARDTMEFVLLATDTLIPQELFISSYSHRPGNLSMFSLMQCILKEVRDKLVVHVQWL